MDKPRFDPSLLPDDVQKRYERHVKHVQQEVIMSLTEFTIFTCGTKYFYDEPLLGDYCLCPQQWCSLGWTVRY